MSERLHKFLAQHGFGSRRELEQWMLEGRVLLNGRAAAPGDRYSAGDKVVIDGRDITARLRANPAAQSIVYHKPAGQPLKRSLDEAAPVELDDGSTVFNHLPAVRGSRWLAINRMHAGDSGLLLLTTDGKLADALMRRALKIPTNFSVRTLGSPEREGESLQTSVHFQDERVDFESIEPSGGEGANRWFLVRASHAGHRAAIRALFESQGFTVSRVIQLAYGPIELPRDLPRGRHRALSEEETGKLYGLADMSAPVEAPSRPARKASDRKNTKKKTPGKKTTTGRQSSRR